MSFKRRGDHSSLEPASALPCSSKPSLRWSIRNGTHSYSGQLEKFRTLRHVAARPAEFRIVVEHHFIFPMEPRQQLADGVEPHQCPPVDTHEQLRVERILQRVERAA